MEDFETKALDFPQFQPNIWKRFVDNTYVISPHGWDKLDLLFQHINSQSDSIKLTKEVEVYGIFPLLDVIISRMGDVSMLR